TITNRIISTMIRSTIVPMYYKDYFVNFAPEPYFSH
ncbi:hypothetical protein JOC59_001860, partial [Weissella beninensis]|nr:hypothetical protein [Periweissella beninensis]